MLRNASILTIAALLAACGGGSAGGGASSATPAEVRPLADIKPSVGDFYSYQELYTMIEPAATSAAGGPPPLWYSNVVTSVNADGSWVQDQILDDPSLVRGQTSILADGDSSAYVSGQCTSTYARTYTSGKKDLTVGASWNVTTTTSYSPGCGALPPVTSTSTTTVAALETVTVRAGTFKTAKLVSSASMKSADGTTNTRESTSWVESSSNRAIKNSVVLTSVTAAGKRTSHSTTLELQGYAQAKTGRAMLNVERFSGPWSGTFSGTYSGRCSGQVSTAGVLDASCGGGQFAVHGNIDANGNVAFSLNVGSSAGPTFSGKFDTPLSIQGSWSAPDGSSGTWQLNHL
ncbi:MULTISPECIES: hypothetical protein [unclassified Duganella]|uniref:hypothetical protein n=1 Tax=unclassified Duganella TaxID=2636909 RepID=UPI000E348F86|nr:MULTISPECIES: hypothetical protein [unclassified Duganella]RFP09956.1 hypothetical protein D0T23_23440 [Duganella sp. BJB475]RFP25741.1 hypothetical protein D0T21_27170 [Duganella sp. BJB476]